MNTIETMPPDARVWVYQNDKLFTAEQKEKIQTAGSSFINDWTAHGASLKASLDVLNNCFIVIAVDEQQAMASGCGIDKSVKFIKDIEKELNLNLFDRFQVAYRKENEIEICPYSVFEKLAEQGMVNENTIVFNNMVASKSAFDKEWELPLKNSWQSRVLKAVNH